MMDIRNADCMDLMREFPDKHFDLAIVDPPYGIGATWSKSRKDRFYKNGALHSYQNEDAPCEEYFAELFRVSKNQVIWGANYFTNYLPPTNAWIIWDKDRNAAVTFMSEAEMAWTSFSKVCRIAKYRWDGAKKCEETTKVHPHQKPVKLYKWILENYAKKGDKILDTYLGSGSIAIACHYLGFDLTACEIDKDYYQAAMKRIKEQTAQKALF